MDSLFAALDELKDELYTTREMISEREREGGEPLAQFMDELDELLPELADLCERRWMLELLLRVCRLKEGR